MRILQIVHRAYPDNSSGVPVHLNALCTTLAKRGHALAVLAGAPENADKTSLSETPMEYGTLYRAHVPRSRGALRWIRLHRLLLDVLHAFRPDVAHIQHLHHLSPFWLRQLRSRGIPVVLNLHDYWYLCPQVTLFDSSERVCSGPGLRCGRCVAGAGVKGIAAAVKFSVRPPLMRLAASYANVFAVPSSVVAELHGRAWALDSSAFFRFSYGQALPMEQTSGARKPGPVRFGYIGGLKPHKGVYVLLKAFSLLRRPADLHVYGFGTEADLRRTKSLIGTDERVVLHGEYDHKDAASVFSSFDALVAPSLWEETFGIVAQEALAAGKLVIASRIGGLAEQMESNPSGILVPPGDAPALAEALSNACDRVERPAETSSGRGPVLRTADTAGDWESLYGRLLAKR